MKWCRLSGIPILSIPNEGKRSPSNGVNLRKAGLSGGVPDLLVPQARGGYFGLFLELKRNREYRISEKQTKTWKNQEMWIDFLNKAGYWAKFVYGWEEASKIIVKYMAMVPTLSLVNEF